jgi:lipase
VSERLNVAVAGGELAAFSCGGDGETVLAVHGITSSSRTWVAVNRALDGRARLIAPDLRGRGRSHQLPPPYGIAAHAADMAAVLEHEGVRSALAIGHSLGAYIVARLAHDRPDLVRSVLLVDGGLPIPGSQGVDPQAFLETFLGPAIARLQMTFPSREAYREWWRAHPAIGSDDVASEDLAAYADHDLVGQEPELRPAVATEAVREDAADLVRFGNAAGVLEQPARILCAPRGLQNEPRPMQPLELCQGWAAAAPDRRQATLVENVNHYTIVLGRPGASVVADAIAAAL